MPGTSWLVCGVDRLQTSWFEAFMSQLLFSTGYSSTLSHSALEGERLEWFIKLALESWLDAQAQNNSMFSSFTLILLQNMAAGSSLSMETTSALSHECATWW